jgi:hypothetical protein
VVTVMTLKPDCASKNFLGSGVTISANAAVAQRRLLVLRAVSS